MPALPAHPLTCAETVHHTARHALDTRLTCVNHGARYADPVSDPYTAR